MVDGRRASSPARREWSAGAVGTARTVRALEPASQTARAGPALAWCLGCLWLAPRAVDAEAPASGGGAEAGRRAEGAGAGPRAAEVEGPRMAEMEGPEVPRSLVPVNVQIERGRGDGGGGVHLEPIGGGRLRHRDPRFTAIVAADGSVEFYDRKVKGEVGLMGYDLLGRKRDGKEWGAGDDFKDRAQNPERRLPAVPMLVGLGGRFGGLADWAIRTRHAAAKSRFLAATEGLRMRMGHRWLKERLAEQQDAVIGEAIAVWRDPALALTERKRRLFALWEACESGAGAPDGPTAEVRAEAAERARTRLEALIRVLAPAGSPQQFTAAELAAFNAGRRGRAAFAPYRGEARRALPLRPRASGSSGGP